MFKTRSIKIIVRGISKKMYFKSPQKIDSTVKKKITSVKIVLGRV